MRKLLIVLVAGALLALAHGAKAAEPLVGVDWVKENTGKAGVVFLDVRDTVDYMRGHIPGAVLTSYGRDGWRVRDKNGIFGMLPEPDALAELIGGLGIDNDTHVVIVPWGFSAREIAIATRIYWTFKVAGHDAVSMLDGGMNAYMSRRGNPLEKGRMKEKPQPKTFAVTLRHDMLPTKADVVKARERGVATVDNRPPDQFLGVNGRLKRKGTIPDSKNLPLDWLTVNGGGRFRDKSSLERLYALAGIKTDEDQITFCNTGQMASVGWFAAHELLGNKKATMYDGSMFEWVGDSSLPVETAVELK